MNRTDEGRYQVGRPDKPRESDPRYDKMLGARHRARYGAHVMAIWDREARNLGGEIVPEILEMWYEGDRWDRA